MKRRALLGAVARTAAWAVAAAAAWWLAWPAYTSPALLANLAFLFAFCG